MMTVTKDRKMGDNHWQESPSLKLITKLYGKAAAGERMKNMKFWNEFATCYLKDTLRPQSQIVTFSLLSFLFST